MNPAETETHYCLSFSKTALSSSANSRSAAVVNVGFETDRPVRPGDSRQHGRKIFMMKGCPRRSFSPPTGPSGNPINQPLIIRKKSCPRGPVFTFLCNAPHCILPGLYHGKPQHQPLLVENEQLDAWARFLQTTDHACSKLGQITKPRESIPMNSIVYIVGAIVIIVVILKALGLF